MDLLMVFLGTVMAMANGVVLPLMCIVFGDMTDSLVNFDYPENITSHPSEFLVTSVGTHNSDDRNRLRSNKIAFNNILLLPRVCRFHLRTEKQHPTGGHE